MSNKGEDKIKAITKGIGMWDLHNKYLARKNRYHLVNTIINKCFGAVVKSFARNLIKKKLGSV